DELVIKPVDGSGGKGLVIGPAASKDELDELRGRLVRDPRGWIAQPVVQLSTIPTLVDDGMRPRHADLRPFAVNDGNDIWVLPGGLTRVALPEGELVVNSSQGGGSKDTWVVGQDPLQIARHSIQGLVAGQAAATESITIITPEMLKAHLRDHAPGERPLGQGQQEQQQQQRTFREALEGNVPGGAPFENLRERAFPEALEGNTGDAEC
ncbi:MAG: circularly permuted type 2 ATP-grasp protein, partial [Rhodoglobus sp.]|nr:circularly permuted type 2 ATP-grasp protein [Rhodoglobus sp.]